MQTAQQDPIFERLTDKAREVLQGAEREARSLNHEFIDTEHVLLSMLNLLRTANLGPLEPEDQAFSMFTSASLTTSNLLEEVRSRISRHERRLLPEHLLQTPETKKVVEVAQSTAQELRHHRVGMRHLLIGLSFDKDTAAGKVLAGLGFNTETAKQELEQAVARVGQKPPAQPEDWDETLAKAAHTSVSIYRIISHTVFDRLHLLTVASSNGIIQTELFRIPVGMLGKSPVMEVLEIAKSHDGAFIVPSVRKANPGELQKITPWNGRLQTE